MCLGVYLSTVMALKVYQYSWSTSSYNMHVLFIKLISNLKEYKVVLLLVFLICNTKQYAVESMFSPLQGSPLSSSLHP